MNGSAVSTENITLADSNCRQNPNFDNGLSCANTEWIRFAYDSLDPDLVKLANITDTGGVLARQVLQGALEVTFPGAAGFFTKQTGRAINPRMELAFQSVPFRSFAFDFDFAPKNLKEVQMVNKMMQLFKFHMLPDVSDEKYLITPSEFQISYYYRDRANMYIPKISRCVLTDMSIDYSPEGVFHTFKADDKGAMPVISNMKLTFSETEIMTKQTTAEGY